MPGIVSSRSVVIYHALPSQLTTALAYWEELRNQAALCGIKFLLKGHN